MELIQFGFSSESAGRETSALIAHLFLFLTFIIFLSLRLLFQSLLSAVIKWVGDSTSVCRQIHFKNYYTLLTTSLVLGFYRFVSSAHMQHLSWRGSAGCLFCLSVTLCKYHCGVTCQQRVSYFTGIIWWSHPGRYLSKNHINALLNASLFHTSPDSKNIKKNIPSKMTSEFESVLGVILRAYQYLYIKVSSI